MHTLVILVAVGICAVTVTNADPHKCMRLGQPHTMSCCKKKAVKGQDEKMAEEIKECFQGMPKPPPSCEHDICIAKKRGYGFDDGTFDKKAFEAELDSTNFEDLELVDVIKKQCLEGDLSDYGPPDMCDVAKLKHCVSLEIALSCPEWDDKGHCSGLKELAEECAKE